MGLATELQGEGTYTYNCKKPDCYWCELMKPKSIEEILPKLWHWEMSEIRILYKHPTRNYRMLMDLLPGRTESAIRNMQKYQKIKITS